MNASAPRIGCVLAVALASACLLTACEDRAGQQTAGQKLDRALARTEQTASDIQLKTEELGEKARVQVDASVTRAEPALRQGAAQAQEALKGAGATVANALDDTAITAAVTAGLAKDPDLSAVKIDVRTKAGIVTLRGPAPSALAKARAAEIARGVRGVTAVNNELAVAG